MRVEIPIPLTNNENVWRRDEGIGRVDGQYAQLDEDGIGSDSRAETANCYNAADYYPLGLGDTWRYTEREWYSDGDLDEHEYTLSITGTEMIDGVEAAKVVDDDGDYDLFSNTNGVTMYRSVDFEAHDYREECTYSPPIDYSPAVICVGDEQSFSSDITCKTYEGNTYVGSSFSHLSGSVLLEGVEKVTVPADRFDNCLKLKIRRRVSVSGNEVESSEMTLWMAHDVGHVKQSEKLFASGDQGGTPIETDDD